MNEALIKDMPLPLRRLVIAFFIRGNSTRETSKRFSMPLEQVEEVIRWRLRPERYEEKPRHAKSPSSPVSRVVAGGLDR